MDVIIKDKIASVYEFRIIINPDNEKGSSRKAVLSGFFSQPKLAYEPPLTKLKFQGQV